VVEQRQIYRLANYNDKENRVSERKHDRLHNTTHTAVIMKNLRPDSYESDTLSRPTRPLDV